MITLLDSQKLESLQGLGRIFDGKVGYHGPPGALSSMFLLKTQQPPPNQKLLVIRAADYQDSSIYQCFSEM